MRASPVTRCALLWLCACGTNDLYLGSDLPVGGTEVPAAAGDTPAPPLPIVSGMPDAAAPDAAPPPVTTPPAPDAALPPAPSPPDAGPPSCEAWRGDCDGDAMNGCETDLDTDPGHCGACDVPCGFPDCGCEGGRPVLSCPADRADCNADTADGCETPIDADVRNCGGCGVTCPAFAFEAPGGSTCVDGACVLTCEALHADCDGDLATGCEVNIWLDNNNCGACGTVCNCSAGTCQ